MYNIEINSSANAFGNDNIFGIGKIIEGDEIHVTKIVNIYNKSDEYKELACNLGDLIKRKSEIQEITNKYPDENIFIRERNKVDSEIEKVQEKIKNFKAEVVSLYELFIKIPINTGRLKKAKEFFDAGKFREADAILKTEDIENDVTHLKSVKSIKENELRQTMENLKHRAYEYIIKAQIRATDYTNSEWFSQACNFYENALDAYRAEDMLFEYACFLQRHNQNTQSEDFYKEALKEYQILTKFDPDKTNLFITQILNNLAGIHKDKNDFKSAEAEYAEALTICSNIPESYSKIYLHVKAMTLNGLASLHSTINEQSKAKAEYEEALSIIRSLTESEPKPEYSRDIALILYNLAILYKNENEFEKSEAAFNEALNIFRSLSDSDTAYIPYVAMTLNSLAALHKYANKYSQAETEFNEALTIRKKLAEYNPQTHLPEIALILINMAVLHQDNKEFSRAESENEEALTILRTLSASNPEVYHHYLAMTLNNQAVLHKANNEFSRAETELNEALSIRRNLSEFNPMAYLPFVAETLNNLAELHSKNNDFNRAETELNESLSIYKDFATTNPTTYLPFVAQILMNMAIFYIEDKPDKEKSISLAMEAYKIVNPLYKKIPFLEWYYHNILSILKANGVDISNL